MKTRAVIYRNPDDKLPYIVRVFADTPQEAKDKTAHYGKFIRFAAAYEIRPVRLNSPQLVT